MVIIELVAHFTIFVLLCVIASILIKYGHRESLFFKTFVPHPKLCLAAIALIIMLGAMLQAFTLFISNILIAVICYSFGLLIWYLTYRYIVLMGNEYELQRFKSRVYYLVNKGYMDPGINSRESVRKLNDSDLLDKAERLTEKLADNMGRWSTSFIDSYKKAELYLLLGILDRMRGDLQGAMSRYSIAQNKISDFCSSDSEKPRCFSHKANILYWQAELMLVSGKIAQSRSLCNDSRNNFEAAKDTAGSEKCTSLMSLIISMST